MSTTETPAFSSFYRNFNRLGHVWQFLTLEFKRNVKVQKSFHARMESLHKQLGLKPLKSAADRKRFMARFEKLDAAHSKEVADTKAREYSILVWMPVMMVTFTEAYLQDALAYLAALDKSLMQESKIAATYSEILEAEQIGITGLASDLRNRWARAFVDDGGPTRWIDRLGRMGARYDPNLKNELELIWGIRHVVVHSAGIATNDFVSRHPVFGASRGRELEITLEKTREWTGHVWEFAKTTDSFILRRTSALLERPKLH